MTLIVGIPCKRGVVLAADSAATFSVDGVHATIGQQEVQKIHELEGAGLYAATGSIGASQQVCNALRKVVAGGQLQQPGIVTLDDAMAVLGKSVAVAIAPLLEQARAVVPLVGAQRAGENALCKSLVAVAVTRAKTPTLYQLAESGAPERVCVRPGFSALGSGETIADPFLAFLKRILWPDREPTIGEGKFAAAWTIHHVALTNAGGVAEPLQMATLTLDDRGIIRATLESDDALQEHLGAVVDAEEALRAHLTGTSGEAVPEVPMPAQPAAAPARPAATDA